MWIIWHRIGRVLHFWMRTQRSPNSHSKTLWFPRVICTIETMRAAIREVLEVKGRESLQANAPPTVLLIYYGLSSHFPTMSLFLYHLNPDLDQHDGARFLLVTTTC